ncbi:MAG: hypothetical protein HGB14_02105 [Anaerolineaceae bacterium]|nr:hypothetical protein [Anaerolineaceae bacterium]
MRQAGVLAAAGLVALEEMPRKLAEDHRHARMIAERVRQLPGVKMAANDPQTNMVFLKFDLQNHKTIQQLYDRLKSKDIFVGITGTSTIRLVTHLNINDDDIEKTIHYFSELSNEFFMM